MKSLAALLSEHRSEILQRWKARVVAEPHVPEARRLTVLALEDDIPRLLDKLIDALAPDRTREALAAGTLRFGPFVLSQKHGRQRQRSGYALESAVRELSLLRVVVLEIILAEAEQEPAALFTPAMAEGVLLVHRAIDECMAISAAEMERQALAALESERELRERFLAVLAHDLCSPLTSVVSSAQLLLRQGIVEPQVPIVERIIRGARRIERMVSDLLDFSEVRMGQIPIRRTPGELATIVRELIESFASTHPERAVDITTETRGEGEWDADRVAQMLDNLLLNACAHSPADAAISVAVRDDGVLVALDVHNEGSPIPPEDLPCIFEPFRRGSRVAPTTRGLGLGLYIAREIARAHGGAIDVLSREGIGTRFTVRLSRKP